ncbi:MAG: S1C family serine protease [Mesorhizobium sp.]|nr:S1C family serine protease [Mesorhizobium sp.]
MPASPLRHSVVALRARIPDDAFTAGVLGTERTGSGVVIGANGLVLTIGYLITEADEVWLTRHDGRVVAGHALAYDQETGFGLVKAVGDLDLPALPLGNSTSAKVGTRITLADGIGQAVEGEIVARQEFAGYWEYLLDSAIFTAPAHPSWGGAALVGADGRLLGIGSLRLEMMQDGEVAAINMSVPIDLLKPILDDLVTRGRTPAPPRPWLGAYAAEQNGEVIVMSVADGGPAAAAGLRRGDVIAELRDKEVQGLADFYRTLWSSGPVGTELPLRVVRDGRENWLRVKPIDRAALLRHAPPGRDGSRRPQ